ncbi:helix-turn-helix domain-containing protein [bacterium 210820-DFI.6.37]|nr:helix-turn-helix domain-containing protein [bacterium 210820-DFI.6.37]
MYLRKDTAIKIIKEISMILDYDINIMDEKGAILASTDPARVGMFHEGAFLIIHNHLKELAVYEDGQYQGCRKGINLPIFLKDKIIGVIGITGEVSEVIKYGKVLKKMTEILAMDLFSYHKKSQQEQARLFFINEWLGREPFEFLSAFHDELRGYGFSEKDSYAVALVTPPLVLDNAEDLEEPHCLYAQNNDMGIVIYCTKQTDQIAGFIKRAAQNAGVSSFLCAIGGIQSDYTGVKRSYEQAQKLLQLNSGCQGLFCYEDCVAELIFHDVSLEYKEILIRQLLSNFSETEKQEFADFMDIYVRCNGSVTRIAERLFVHKNTVQYKINKILKKTGKDPRVLEDAIILTMVAGWTRHS